MKVGLIDIEPKIFNTAYMQISKYHKTRGNTVEWWSPLTDRQFDHVYCSSLFDFTDKSGVTDDMECGGTGFTNLIGKELPPDIHTMKPKINIGFTTRGCIRNCSFCVVPKKEGRMQVVGDIYDFWDGKSKKIELLERI